MKTMNFSVGDHLVTPRCGYVHHGIYVGSGRVIHYAGFSRLWWPGPVEEISVELFSLGHPVSVHVVPGRRFDGPGCANRARQRLGERRFSLFTNNCEHFSAWCEQGISRSTQIEALYARLYMALVAFSTFALPILRR
ncbi:lecithin retinol acyltransferase family protein [Variovorax saccharolyticus]|uniref:lecithin retinol acyltransferase family protein n=1 Tax=Variovorax saccharolyticus TaxID=3053516 RepID=UPI002576BCC3|nr:lecithin retinol acyltransferase family protein [Variovorax sp. J31P216]MDM0030141.1 lecithin retinol acyltransferase family protein [Variovorax sp. J31P216]